MKELSAKTPGCDVIYDFIEQAPKPEASASNDSAHKAPLAEAVCLGCTTILEFVEQVNHSPLPPES